MLVVLAEAAGAESVRSARVASGVVIVHQRAWNQVFSVPIGSIVGTELVLENTSRTRDALHVRVEVNMLDRAGVSQGEWIRELTAIPAGTEYYFAFRGVLLNRVHIAGIRTSIKVGALQPKRIVLPPVKNIQLGSYFIRGVVVNPYKAPLLRDRLTFDVVLFDTGGHPLVGNNAGGDSLFPDYHQLTIPPGGKAPFQFDLPQSVVSPDRIAYARFSVDPGVLPRGNRAPSV